MGDQEGALPGNEFVACVTVETDMPDVTWPANMKVSNLTLVSNTAELRNISFAAKRNIPTISAPVCFVHRTTFLNVDFNLQQHCLYTALGQQWSPLFRRDNECSQRPVSRQLSGYQCD